MRQEAEELLVTSDGYKQCSLESRTRQQHNRNPPELWSMPEVLASAAEHIVRDMD